MTEFRLSVLEVDAVRGLQSALCISLGVKDLVGKTLTFVLTSVWVEIWVSVSPLDKDSSRMGLEAQPTQCDWVPTGISR